MFEYDKKTKSSVERKRKRTPKKTHSQKRSRCVNEVCVCVSLFFIVGTCMLHYGFLYVLYILREKLFDMHSTGKSAPVLCI